ncbi:MAG: hypothetical protein OXO52_00395 [Rhodospirillales bacterium]|nr:hypothetical protein [Rhodospirillales bacterium]MDE0382052.1 hypothetical protein [Rhodospirillales bacterium]
MTARSIDKRTDNILIGAGEVYLDIHEGGAATGERYLGDAVGAELEVATEETTVFSGSGPVARELTRIARSVTRTVRLTLHDISLENLALFTVGEVKRLDAADHVSGEAAVLRPGRWYQLGGADRPAGVLRLAAPADKAAAIAAVTVATTAQAPVTATQAIAAGQFGNAASETEQKGQYVVDYARARIFWLPPDHALYEAKAGVEAGTALAVDYTPDDAPRDQVQGAFRQLIGAFRYIEDAAEGQGRNIYAPRCSIQPAGGLTLLDGRSSEQQIRLAVSMLEPGAGLPALYIDGQAA